MNAPFALPIEAVSSAYDRAHADGELNAGMSMLEHATRALSMGTWHVERALANGSGASLDLVQIERIAAELADLSLRVETATSLLTGKVRS